MIQESSNKPSGAIVVVAKCPIPGVSKTRLIKLLGKEGSTLLAEAMLKDVVLNISHCSLLDNVTKVLLYAPGDESGLEIMQALFQKFGLESIPPQQEMSKDAKSPITMDSGTKSSKVDTHKWFMLPMASSSNSSLTSSNLGTKLADALVRVRQLVRCACTDHLSNNCRKSKPPIIFLGMDSPELPLKELAYALEIAQQSNNNNESGSKPKAYINPAHDGGYGMICLPYNVPPNVFEGIRWSCALTAISQIKSLTDLGVDVKVGSLMYDVDEEEDIYSLIKRTCNGKYMNYSRKENNESESDKHNFKLERGPMMESKDDVLQVCAIKFDSVNEKVSRHQLCSNTIDMLRQMNLLTSSLID